MAQFLDLPEELQNAILTVTNTMRQESGMFSAMATRLRAQVDSTGTKMIKQAVESLDAGATIPNAAGFPGAVAITKEQWLTLHNTADAVADVLTAEVKQACIDAAGPWKAVGQ